jgi:hypothetical protein
MAAAAQMGPALMSCAAFTRWTASIAIVGLALCAAAVARADSYVVIVRGLAGGEQYEVPFTDHARTLQESAARATGAGDRVIALVGAEATRAKLREALAGLARRARAQDTVALLLIGHGSYDGHEYKLNLPGPDVTAEELAKLLRAIPAKRQLVVNTTGASGASATVLEGEGRVIITATRSGNERIAPRFGRYFAASLVDPAADTDKDGWVTAAEAFAYAKRQVDDAFQRDTLLATEHAQLLGTGADGFLLARTFEEGFAEAARAGAAPAAAPVGDAALGEPLRAALLARRTDLDRALAELRAARASMAEDTYYAQLDALLQEIAQVDVELEAAPSRGATPDVLDDTVRDGAPR